MRVRCSGLVKNPNIIKWAEKSLLVAGAAVQCPDHDCIRSRNDPAAVRRAVSIGRLVRFEDLSPDAAELALLETYLQLPECCPHCETKLKTPKMASPAN